jgi:Zn-finger nucleic acid-binding protein/RNA polymerase subunit RPABC4/transcription elongation factor Spt4
MESESLNCPNCGAAVSSDKTLCQFCGSRLKTVACPKCFGLMFLGSKFCGHCGASAIAPDVITDEKAGSCPRCKIHLGLLAIGETTLRECENCGGLWADVETFENVCADNERQSSVLGFLGKNKRLSEAPAKISYVPCPDCSQLMNRSNFAHSSGVIVDMCKHHGVWFDADELPKIIDFIHKGGMEHARQRELNEIKDERARLSDEMRIQSARDERFDVGKMWDRDENAGIRGFIKTLFD